MTSAIWIAKRSTQKSVKTSVFAAQLPAAGAAGYDERDTLSQRSRTIQKDFDGLSYSLLTRLRHVIEDRLWRNLRTTGYESTVAAVYDRPIIDRRCSAYPSCWEVEKTV